MNVRRLLAITSMIVASTSGTSSAQKTGASLPPRTWVSAGFGPSHYPERSGGGVRTSANLAFGPVVGMVRGTIASEGLDSWSSYDETSVLVGVRRGCSHLYAIPAIGIGKVHWRDEERCARVYCPGTLEELGLEARGLAVAYDLGLHMSSSIVGLALNIFGEAAGPKKRLFGFALSLEVGWMK